MSYLDDLYQSFQDQIESIFQLSKVPEEIIKLAQGSLNIVETELKYIRGYPLVKDKIHRQTNLLKTIQKSPALNEKFHVFHNQIIVLMVGALEAHLYELVGAIANHNPEIFVFEPKKKISFDPEILRDGATIGDVVRHYFKEQDKNVSFQDLQSTLRFLEDYLGISIELDEGGKDVLIFSAACRHVSVHNNAIIDKGFLTQIRDTHYSSEEVEDDKGKKIKKYQRDQNLAVTSKDVNNLKEAVTAFSANLIAEVEDRIKNESQ